MGDGYHRCSADTKDHNWGFFHASGSALATEHANEIDRMKALKGAADTTADPDGSSTPASSIFDTDQPRFGIGIKKLHTAMFTILNEIRSIGLRRRALAMSIDDERRQAFIRTENCKCTKQLLPMIPRKHMKMSNTHWKSAVQNKFGQDQSLLAQVKNLPLNNAPANRPQETVNRYGQNLKNIMKGGWRSMMHNNLQDLMSKELRQADIHHSGGRFGHTRTCEGVFSAEVNGGLPLPNDDEEGAKWLRGIVPDLIIHGNGLSEAKERDPAGLHLPDEETIVDFKTLGPGRSYTVDSRQRKSDDRVHDARPEAGPEDQRHPTRHKGSSRSQAQGVQRRPRLRSSGRPIW